ncbi:MAG TPA: VOC family protein [Streptosporangiaceae bacterium]|jgi:catechol 2,3-dioxygenase-like lactoylglutathione lyase family enzyme
MGSIWHIGFAVHDLEKGTKELAEVFGLRWRPARARKLRLADAAGRSYEVECHVAFSLGGPFAVEVWQAIPGTPLDIPQAGGVHHIGYWVDDLAAETKRLDALGYPSYATVGTTPLLNRGPAGTLIELCDLHSDRPSLRDLFPSESEFAGEPDLGSAL